MFPEQASAPLDSPSGVRKRQRTLSITHKFGNRAREPKTAFNFVILSAVFGAKDLTRPDMRNPNYSVEGRCQRAFNRLKKEVVYVERAPK